MGVAGVEVPQISKEDFIKIAEIIVMHYPGKFRIAFNEADTTKEFEKEAAHFLKLEDKRFGRDLELYGFMASMGPEQALVQFLEEILCPIKVTYPNAYIEASEVVKNMGLKIYDKSLHDAWKELF